MKALLAVVLLACGGPTHQQLVETPSATAPRRPATPPPASTSDTDRERAWQQFEDMETAQRAHQEAGQGQGQTQKPQSKGAKPPVKPVKTGPAEQAPAEPAPPRK